MDKNLRLRLIMEGLDRLTKPLKSVQSQSGATGRALKVARDRVKQLEGAQRDIAAYRGHEQSVVGLQLKLAEQRRTVDQLRAAYLASDRPTKTLTKNYTNAREALSRLEREQNEHRDGLRATAARLAQVGVSTADLARHEGRLADELKDANRQIDAQKTKLGQLAARQRRIDGARSAAGRTEAFAGSAAVGGATAVGAGIAMAAPLALAGREAMKFEDSMADVRKVVDFPAPASFKAFTADLVNMSTRLPVAADGLGLIAAAGARAGVPLADLVGFTETAAKMGVAFDLSAEDAGTMMATWRSAFGMGQKDVVQLANQVNALTNAYGGTPAAVSEMITRIGPLGKVAGVSAGSIGALAQLMNSVGLESEIGATGIKNMMLALSKGEAATKAQKKAFTDLGLDASKVSQQMQTDSQGAITSVLEAIAKLPEAQQAGMLTQLFGSESVAAIAPLLTRLDALKRNFRDVGNAQFYASSMDKEYAARASTTSTAVDLAKNSAKALAIEIGTTFLPVIKATSGALGGAAQRVRDFSQRHPAATKVIVGFVAVLSGLLIVFGGLALGIAAILAPFALLQGAWAMALPLLMPLGAGISAAAGAVWAFTAALLANPITWIVLAVVALAAAAWLIYKNWGRVSTWFGQLWDRIKQKVAMGLQALQFGLMNFSPVGLFIRAFAALWPMLQNLGSRFRQIGGQLIDGLIRGVVGKLTALRSTIVNAASSAARWFREKLGIHSPSRVFADYGGHVMSGLALGLERARTMPLDALSATGAAMAGALAAGSVPTGASAAPAQYQQGGDVYEIHIHAAAGQDAGAIADEVLRRIEAKTGARARSSMRDRDE
ncbi:phage tail tape measure protein [Brevundimonas nasdae]|uniref:phage tail tape measure protein n=1 Tax=Brevundimonas nasdae TaxID=172043 RepID=UPI003F692506